MLFFLLESVNKLLDKYAKSPTTNNTSNSDAILWNVIFHIQKHLNIEVKVIQVFKFYYLP